MCVCPHCVSTISHRTASACFLIVQTDGKLMALLSPATQWSFMSHSDTVLNRRTPKLLRAHRDHPPWTLPCRDCMLSIQSSVNSRLWQFNDWLWNSSSFMSLLHAWAICLHCCCYRLCAVDGVDSQHVHNQLPVPWLLLLIVFHCIVLYFILLYFIVAYFCPAPLFNFISGVLQIQLIDWLIDKTGIAGSGNYVCHRHLSLQKWAWQCQVVSGPGLALVSTIQILNWSLTVPIHFWLDHLSLIRSHSCLVSRMTWKLFIKLKRLLFLLYYFHFYHYFYYQLTEYCDNSETKTLQDTLNSHKRFACVDRWSELVHRNSRVTGSPRYAL